IGTGPRCHGCPATGHHRARTSDGGLTPVSALSTIAPRVWRPILILVVTIVTVVLGCQKPPAAKSSAKSPKVASLVPAATDLIVGMGAADHLVAVSTFDTRRAEIKELPRVGDYQQIDWERLGVIRPDVMIVFMSPQRMPAAVRQRAEEMKIQLVNVRTERLDDIFAELTNLGNLLHEPEKATA